MIADARYAQSGTASAPAPGAQGRCGGIADGLNFLSFPFEGGYSVNPHGKFFPRPSPRFFLVGNPRSRVPWHEHEMGGTAPAKLGKVHFKWSATLRRRRSSTS